MPLPDIPETMPSFPPLGGSKMEGSTEALLTTRPIFRCSLIEEQSREIAKLQKVFEGANTRLSGVATNVAGKSWTRDAQRSG